MEKAGPEDWQGMLAVIALVGLIAGVLMAVYKGDVDMVKNVVAVLGPIAGVALGWYGKGRTIDEVIAKKYKQQP